MGTVRKDGDVVGYFYDGPNGPEMVNEGSAKELAYRALGAMNAGGGGCCGGGGVATDMPPGGYPATTEELLVFMRTRFDECLRLAEQKNGRYAKFGDPFKNLSRGGGFGIAVRMDDKVSRLLTLTQPGNEGIDPLDESITDTCRDLINYAALLMALRAHLGGDK